MGLSTITTTALGVEWYETFIDIINDISIEMQVNTSSFVCKGNEKSLSYLRTSALYKDNVIYYCDKTFELVVDDELKSEIIVSTNIDDVEYVGKFVILDA